MEFQHSESLQKLVSICASSMPAQDAWNMLIDFHAQTVPKPYWAELRKLDIGKEVAETSKWIEGLATESPIPDHVVALWFGICKFLGDDESEIPTLYMVGADAYDEDDSEWACDVSYLPEDRYQQPESLQQLDNIARACETDYEFLDWILPLAYCAFIVDESLRTRVNKQLFLKARPEIFVALGHDGGYCVNLASVR